jgi:uncharacterized protein YyaL (SSP411 family)
VNGRNRLANESSPYLRQHADNPVDWYPWGDEAFAAARERDVPVLLSVGYSACHWCHVMAHESFEDDDIAAQMNRLFVNVKVDREERPDVDAIYMEATQSMTGQGGWPMTVFMTADGEPFFCGTYFPKVPRGGMPSFPQLCDAIDDAWRHRRPELLEQAGQLTAHLRRAAALPSDREVPGVEVLGQAEAALVAAHDERWGGFGRAPKFPQSMSIDFLLRQARRTGSHDARRVAEHSLDAMAAGGIYDHIGGGFARYSVDDQWLVPHFEKMLYDNALLIRPYLHAWQLTGANRHLEVVTQTITYLARDLRHPDGGFFSAEDADSPVPGRHGEPAHNEEGWFSTWTLDEVRDVLGPAAEDVIAWYGMTERGNFEGRNIPFRPIGEFERPPEIEAARHHLAEARATRPRPGLDDKVLTEWNGLLLASLSEAAAATGDADWRDLAVSLAEFLLTHLRRDDGRWLRSWQADAGAKHLAYAHDHAALVDGLTRLYELTGAARWLDEAVTTADALVALFADEAGGGFFTTGADAEALLTRPKDLQDNATPASQSTAAVALLRLASLVDRPDLAAHAERILATLGEVAGQHPLAFAQVLQGVEIAAGLDEIVITGHRPDLVELVQRTWLPNAVRSWGEPLPGALWQDREPDLAYVCRNFSCRLPVSDPGELLAQLGSGT